MLEIQYMVTEQFETSAAKDILDKIEATSNMEIVRVKKVEEE